MSVNPRCARSYFPMQSTPSLSETPQEKLSSSEIPTATDTPSEMPTLEKSTVPAHIPPADIGLWPWLQVLGGFFLMFNSWGVLVSFGTFQTYYTNGHGISDQHSPSVISWIGSLQAFLTLFGGAMGGKYVDAGHFRIMTAAGTVLVFFGLMMTSLATKYYQFILAQSVTVGAGTALYVVVAVALPGTWFVKRRGLAIGFVSTGASIGGIVYPITIDKLIPQIGFAWTTRTIAFMTLATLAISLSVLRQRLPPRGRGSFIEYRALRDPSFALYITGIFVTFLGFFGFYNFVGAWATATHVDTKGLPVFYILPIVNAASVFGRVIPSFISDYIGPLNVQTPAIAISGILVLVWMPVHTIGPLMVVAILYGFASGTLIALPPTSIASMTEDLTTLGGRMGVCFAAMATGSLIGSPVMGALVQSKGGSYDQGRIWSGVMLLLGSVFVLMSRMVRTKWSLLAKV